MQRLLQAVGMALAVCLCHGGMRAEAVPEVPLGVEQILAYAGTWRVTTEHFNTANSKAGHENTTLRNECWKNGGYVVCNQYVDGNSVILLVFTYNPREKVFTSYQIPLNGATPGKGTLTIEGNVWTYPWQTGEGVNTTHFRVVNVFVSADQIEYRQEFSADRVHWTMMAKGLETRIGGTLP